MKQKLKILLIEDTSCLRIAITYQLEDAGYEVISVETAEEGISIYKEKTPFDLVITDFNLPIMNGGQLIKEILKINNKAKIILNTGSNITKDEALSWGVAGFRDKFSNIKLTDIIKECK